MSSEQFERGLDCRKAVLGEAYVDAALAKADDFNRDFQTMVTEYCWGGTWGRGVLTRQQRSILNLGMLAALNRQHEFKLHLKGALKNGVSLEEIREILIQIAVCCGIPAVVDALTCALDWQGAVEARAGQVPEERAMRFRIGVNLGDVMAKVDDAEDQVEAKRREREKSARLIR